MTKNRLNQFYHGVALDYLRSLPDESVDFGMSSPPYWGLRDYGTGLWRGGEETCEHRVGTAIKDNLGAAPRKTGGRPGSDHFTCKICGAERIDRQIGLEATVEAYLESERFERSQADPYGATLVFDEAGAETDYEQLPMFTDEG